MKKRTLNKSTWREIRSTMGRFLAIFAITALGSGFFAGLRATGPDMVATADEYFAATNLADMRLLSTFGFTENDIAALEAREDIKAVWPTYGIDLLVESPDGVDAVRLHALPEDTGEANPTYMNQVILTEGRLPKAAGEIAADAESHYKLGDTVTLAASNDEDSLELMAATTYTVVGLVDSPYYISFTRGNTTIGNGSLSTFFYLHPSAFDSEYWLEVYLQLEGTEGLSSQSDEYKALVETALDDLELFGEERAEIRYQEIMTEAEEEIADGQKELDEAREEADQELADAWQEIEDAQKELKDGRIELRDAYNDLIDAERQLADGEAELANGRGPLENGQRSYEEGMGEYEARRTTFEEGVSAYETGAAQLATAWEEYAARKAAWESGGAKLTEGWRRLEEGENGIAALQAAVAELQDDLGQAAALLPLYEAEEDPLLKETYQQKLADAQAQAIEGLRAFAANVGPSYPEMAPGLEAAASGAEQQLQYGLYRDAQATLSAAVDVVASQLDAAATELAASRGELTAQQQELDATGALLDAGYAQLAASQAELDENGALLASGRTALEEGLRQLQEGKAQVDSGWAALASGEAKLNEAREELADGWRKYYEALEELQTGEQELADGIAEYEEAKEDAERELAEAQEEIDDARKELADLETPEWYVFDRTSHPGYEGFGSNVDRISAIATAIPYFFFLVAALVCLTTMTRMVEEQRTGIGTLKALGYTKGAIASKFLIYAGFASLIGSAAGVAIGLFLFPSVVWNAYRMMYIMPSVTYTSQPVLVVQSVLAMSVVTVAATMASCWGVLREVPAELMRPKAPKAGTRVLLERVGFIWKRMKFSHKVTARNLFRYKKRFFMTIIGVAGCTALLVTGFGLYDSINGIVEKQYANVSLYDSIVQLSDPSTATEASGFNTTLAEVGSGAYVSDTAVDVSSPSGDNNGMTTYLSVVEDPEAFTQFVHFRDRKSEQPVGPLSDDGAILTEKLATRLDVSVGDSITVTYSGEERELPVLAIAENYVYNYVYTTGALFEATWGTAPEYDRVYVRYNEEWQGRTNEALERFVATDGVAGAVGMGEMRDEFDNMLSSLDSVVWLIIVCAALLAFVVLYNLTTINVTERQREIATLKVLGFYEGEVAGYVYRENMLLTIIGAAVGLLLGIALHRYVVLTAEIDEVMFGRTIAFMSYVWSLLFTLACAIFVDLVMLKRLKNIDMIASLKSAE